MVHLQFSCDIFVKMCDTSTESFYAISNKELYDNNTITINIKISRIRNIFFKHESFSFLGYVFKCEIFLMIFKDKRPRFTYRRIFCNFSDNVKWNHLFWPSNFYTL